MKNPFKELDKLEESIKAPPSIKRKVMGSYGFITNIAKVVEFIFGSLTNVCSGMLQMFDETPPPKSPPPSIMGLGSFRGDIEDEFPEDREGEWGDKDWKNREEKNKDFEVREDETKQTNEDLEEEKDEESE